MLGLSGADIIYLGYFCLESTNKSKEIIRMSLQFPNARLLIHDLLVGGQSGPEAIAKSANQYGLIPIESVEEVAAGLNGSCGCMATAKNVLLKCIDSQEAGSNAHSVNANQIWSDIELAMERHRTGGSTGISTSACTERDSTVLESNECTRLAPIIFDYMLQQINRYY